MKPISTLMSPLPTVDLASGEPANAQSERSDVTAVPAMGVIAEAMVALALADAMLEKFGGDSLGEMRRNYHAYVAGAGRPLDRVPRPESGRADAAPSGARRACPAAGRAPSASRWPRVSALPCSTSTRCWCGRWGCRWSRSSGWWASSASARWSRRRSLAAVAAEEPAVIVPGGGWAAQPGQMHGAREFALLIYLSCLPRTAAQRAEAGRGQAPPGGRRTRWSGCGSSSRPGNRFTSSLILRWRRMGDRGRVAATVVDLARKRGGW